jgi:predicted nucleotidyltransferase component of viral defense system
MTKKVPTDLGASVLTRLKNLAAEQQEEFQVTLTQYCLERLLDRLAKSVHREKFVLKGALLLRVLVHSVRRVTRDLDLLGFGDSDISGIKKAFTEICATEASPDGVRFDTESIVVSPIRAGQEYGGQRVTLNAFIKTARIPLHIDVGFGDSIVPGVIDLDYPTMLGAPSPHLCAYSLETVVAEKCQAAVSLGLLNSRMKDFYDFHIIAKSHAFVGEVLGRAIRATFERRGTSLPKEIPTAFTEEFSSDKQKQQLWRAYINRDQLTEASALEMVVQEAQRFLWPVLDALQAGRAVPKAWSAGGPWA